MERKTKGKFHLLIKEMMLSDHEYFFRYFRMSPSIYEKLLSWIVPAIKKSPQKREAIGSSERLSVTLRYLVTGGARATIAYSYRISQSAVGRIIKETSQILREVLIKKIFYGYLKVKTSGKPFQTISNRNGTSITVWELLMVNMLLCKHRQGQVPNFLTIKRPTV